MFQSKSQGNEKHNIVICILVFTHDRECFFGHIVDNEMCLIEFGTIVQDEWEKSFVIRRELLRDKFVVMPNHFHVIVRVVDIVGTSGLTSIGTSGRTSLLFASEKKITC
jgi:hypothetical protein